jgi:hypothetical protein
VEATSDSFTHARTKEREEMVARAKRAIDKGLRPWKPGQSGNPGGMAKVYHVARKILRDRSPEMCAELVDLALNAEEERVRSVCLIAALDRAGLKPADYDPKEEDGMYQGRPRFDPSLYTSEELEQLHAAIMLMARKQGLMAPEAAEDMAG